MALTKAEIFAAKDADVVEVDVPEWNGSVLLRPMTGKQRNDYEYWATTQTQDDNPDFRGIRERLIIATAVDDEGEPLFSADDLEALSDKNADVLDRLHKEAQRISGMGQDANEEAAKN